MGHSLLASLIIAGLFKMDKAKFEEQGLDIWEERVTKVRQNIKDSGQDARPFLAF